MTDIDRLIKLVDKAKEEYANDITDHTETDYIVESLLNRGVILPPCKVGDTVCRLAYNKNRSEWQVVNFWEVVKIEIYADEIGIIDDGDNYFTAEDIGKTVFLTKEEAEQALKEREKV